MRDQLIAPTAFAAFAFLAGVHARNYEPLGLELLIRSGNNVRQPSEVTSGQASLRYSGIP